MNKRQYISGIPRFVILFRIMIRVLKKMFARHGILKGTSLFISGMRHPLSVLKDTPNRFIKIKQKIYVLPDVPPLNSDLFADYLINDIEVLVKEAPRKPLFVIFCISSKCVHTCQYCYNKSLHSAEEKIPVNILLSTIEGIIASGIPNIYLSGGEPMIRWDAILLILDTFKNEHVNFWLLTTGSFLNANKMRTLKQHGLTGIMVSLDSENENTINSVKGNPDAFSDAVNAITVAYNTEIPVAVNAVFSKEMLDEIRFNTFISFANDLGVSFINCYTPKGLANEEEAFTLKEHADLALLCKKNQLNQKKRPIAYAPDAWESKRGCVGGKLFIFIDPSGNVRPCPFSAHIYGNINNNSFEEVYSISQNTSNTSICRTMKMIEGKI